MRLLDLLQKIHEHTIIWVSTSADDDCIYFDEAGAMPVGIAKHFDVYELYVEKYPAKSCTGITIIVTAR